MDEEERREDRIDPSEEMKEEEREDAAPFDGKKKGDVGIFVFIAVMALLMPGAIAFVIYVCTGSAAGCNCGYC